MSFPKRNQIFQDRVDKIRDTVARPSLDTYYQVIFSFGGEWLSTLGSLGQGSARTQGKGFQEKMSLLCTQAEIPGTSYVPSSAIGHRQGIQEEFPNLRNFPPLNLSFYCDADHVILEVLETWMTYINPIQTGSRQANAYSRFNYPEEYKETIHITKFERDTFIRESRNASYQSDITMYEFVNAWPSDLTSMRVAYGDSNVLKCTIQFAYDRFFTTFNNTDIQKQVVNTSEGVVNSNDAAVEGGYTISNSAVSAKRKIEAQIHKDTAQYGNTVPSGSFSITSNQSATTRKKNKRGSGAR